VITEYWPAALFIAFAGFLISRGAGKRREELLLMALPAGVRPQSAKAGAGGFFGALAAKAAWAAFLWDAQGLSLTWPVGPSADRPV
jgi:hypothetical protein